jgi:cation-transporting P-type ATPase E
MTEVETRQPSALVGLSSAEVLARRARGLGNDVELLSSRSYSQIFGENVFTFVNSVLFSLGLALVALGRISDALVSVGVVLVNVVVSVVQEVRAKRTLDRVALLTQPRATVLRDGELQVVDPREVVLGDVLFAAPGDQIVVDGGVLAEGRLDVDESLLTGESDRVAKREGDPVYSGSFVVAGTAYYEAQKVGNDSLANQLTHSARAFRRTYTPLQREVNLVIRVILLLAVYIEILLVASSLVQNTALVESVQMSVVIAGLVPNGLFLAIAVAYAMGAVRIIGHGALVQQSNAIESLSHVDVLCLDKTGTLTANRLALYALEPCSGEAADLRQLLGDYAASASARNRTAEALAAACPGEPRRLREEVPFSSERRWSAVAFDDPLRRGVYVLGAPETLGPHLCEGADLGPQAEAWTAEGLRVVLYCAAAPDARLYDADDEPCLPPRLTPLGVVAFHDELRPEARETLAGFAESGIGLKIISGDNPQTVAALARQAGLDPTARLIAGPALAALDETGFAQAAEEVSIFGRITPQQKEALVRALRRRGHHVAMTGDGVNDVLALKQANLGVAMLSGSQATRAVADIVLLNDSFAVLPHAFREGQRIRNGMQNILKLFLTRVLCVTLLILSIGVIGGFPFAPKQASLLALFTVGIPTLALAAWARPGPSSRRGLVRSLLHFVLPAALTLSLVGLAVYGWYLVTSYEAFLGNNQTLSEGELFGRALAIAQSALTTVTILCGLLLIPFVEPPTRAWVGGNRLAGDWRPTLLAMAMAVVYGLILAMAPLRAFFELTSLAPLDYATLVAVAAVWAYLLRFTWRHQLLDRFLSLDLS